MGVQSLLLRQTSLVAGFSRAKAKPDIRLRLGKSWPIARAHPALSA